MNLRHMSDYILPALIIVVVFIWWLSSHSLVGSVARTPETEAALAAVATRVAESLRQSDVGTCEVQPIWAHGCPCVRVSFESDVAHAPPELIAGARKAAARTLEEAIRASPAFAHIAKKYRGEEGLHWY